MRRALPCTVIGGSVDWNGCCMDATAALSVAQMQIDHCLMELPSLRLREGGGTSDLAEAEYKRRLLQASRRTSFYLSNSALGASAAHRICSTKEIQQAIVEQDAPESFLDELRSVGVAIFS
jgi:DeoR/GlpR family transcriptional regulator of sugar metabolism